MKENQLKVISSMILSCIVFILFQNFTTFDFAHDANMNHNKANASLHFNEIIKDKQNKNLAFEESEYHERDIVQIIYKQLAFENQSMTQELTQVVLEESYKYKMDPLFTLAIIKTESRFNPYAIGSAGEIGLMQIKPNTAEYIAKKFKIFEYKQKEDLKNPTVNVKLGLAYFQYLRSKFKKKSYSYVTAYNMGPLSFKRSISSEEYGNNYYEKVVGNYIQLYRASHKTVKFEKLMAVLDHLNSTVYIARD